MTLRNFIKNITILKIFVLQLLGISQGIFITVGDGEDINSGTLMFNVIENGQPRWSGIPTQSFNEGGSSSLVLTDYGSDTDDNGNSVPANTLSLSVVSISDESLLSAEI